MLNAEMTVSIVPIAFQAAPNTRKPSSCEKSEALNMVTPICHPGLLCVLASNALRAWTLTMPLTKFPMNDRPSFNDFSIFPELQPVSNMCQWWETAI